MTSRLSFEPVSLEKVRAYGRRFFETPQKASDYSLVNLWGWQPMYDLHWAWDDPLVWIRQHHPEALLWAPVGPWETVDWPRHFRNLNLAGAVFTRIPESLATTWKTALPGAIEMEPERGNWDYLYLSEELVTLKGNRFHKKKNLVRQFMKKYAHEYVPLDADRIPDALALQEAWCTWRDCESSEVLDAENTVIKRVFGAFSRFPGLLGGGILCDGKMIAYTVGERMDPETLLIHFEKGDPEYTGVYQAINQLFLSHHADEFRFVNREQDLDHPGLRKAKLSYHPVDFVRKFRVVVHTHG